MRYLIVATLSIAVAGIAHAGSSGGIDIVVAPLPEPETLALVGIGALAIVIARWRRNR